MKHVYEWAIETRDEHGDIQNHEFLDSPRLPSPLGGGNREELVLVHDRFDGDGLIDRAWAYIKKGRLSEFFENAYGTRVHKVPPGYRRQVDKLVEAANV